MDLTALGCSTRGLGEELGQSATTVRRHIAIAKLPAAQREAVRNGKSAKKYCHKGGAESGSARP